MSSPPDKDEPFLSRWSRKKRAVTKGEVDSAVEARDVALPEGDAAAGGGAQRTASGDPVAEGREDLDLSTLPDVDGLNEHSDITGFLDSRVPMALRNAALGRMWTLDPTIRDFIEVAENQWNWNIPGGAPFYEPLEGGAEMAEQILSGFSSAAKAVAEAVLPGDGASTLVGGGDGLRAASVCAETRDAVMADDAAVHLESEGEVLSERAPTPVSVRHSEGDAAVAAAQQNQPVGDTEGALRRRHGGALPG